MGAFDKANFKNLYETREKQLSSEEEMNLALIDSWTKKEDAGSAPVLPMTGEIRRVQASMSAGPSKRPGVSTETAAPKTHRDMLPPTIRPTGMILFTKSSDDTTDSGIGPKDKAEYVQLLNGRHVSKFNLSRSTSEQGLFTRSSTSSSMKGKEKEQLFLMPTVPAVSEEQPAVGISVSSKITSPSGKTKTTKIPSKLQIILENFSNFEHAIDCAKGGVKLKLKKGKGMVPLEKMDLQKQSDLFQGCVVAVVHHISAKGEQLVPRWTLVHRHGGKVCIRYTPEVTHIACDHDVNESSICHYLGINDLSEIRKGTLILGWDWFHRSGMSGALLMSDIFERRCLRTQTAVARRASAPSKSDGKRKSASDVLAITVLGKRAKRCEPNDSDTYQDPEGAAGSPTEAGSSYDRWLPPASQEQADGLDAMISGLKTGAEMESKEDLDEEYALLDDNGINTLNAISRQNDGGATDSRNHSAMLEGPYQCPKLNPGTERLSINEDIAVGLESLGKVYESAQHKNTFQKLSYKKSAGIVRNCPFRIKNKQDALKLKGIGDNIADRIEEIIRNGGISDRELFEDNEQARTIAMFGKIYGVGRKAYDLWNQGARSLDDLKTGNWGLSESQKIGLQHYDDLNTRMPRDEARRLFESIQKEVKHICGNGGKENTNLHMEAMGSYRRGEETCGDLDILITRDTCDGKDHKGVLRKLIERLAGKKIVTYTLAAPSNYEDVEAKWMGIGQLVGRDGQPEGPMRRIDILMIPWESYGAALIYFTGNDIFNRSLRLYARINGYILNQRGLYKDVIRNEDGKKTTEGVLVASRSEQEIFDVLNIRYRPPELRRP